MNNKLKILLSDGLEIKYEIKTSTFSIEFKNEIGAGRTLRKTKVDKLDKIQIFVDKSCIEIFLNDGEKVFTTRFYPQEYTLKVMSNNDVDIKLWNLAAMEVRF